MSSNVPIAHGDITAPTPQNTPLTHAPIAAGLSRPTVPDISEDNEPAEDESEDPAQITGAQAAMLGLVQGRLADLVGKSSGYIESLPIDVKKSVEALKGVQVKQNELQNQYKRECLELEKKVRHYFLNLCCCLIFKKFFLSISTSSFNNLYMSGETRSSRVLLKLLRRRSKLAVKLL